MFLYLTQVPNFTNINIIMLSNNLYFEKFNEIVIFSIKLIFKLESQIFIKWLAVHKIIKVVDLKHLYLILVINC